MKTARIVTTARMVGVTPGSVLLLLASLAVATVLADCGQGEECIRQKRCPSFLALKDKFRELTKDTEEHDLALAGLKEVVCNQRRKLVCCPKAQAMNTTYLPVLGECGVSGDAAFIVGGEVGGGGDIYQSRCRVQAWVSDSSVPAETVDL